MPKWIEEQEGSRAAVAVDLLVVENDYYEDPADGHTPPAYADFLLTASTGAKLLAQLIEWRDTRGGLNEHALETLAAAGVSVPEWRRRNDMDETWTGDACGCPDDRCIGFHHDRPDDCRCLPALLGGGR